MEEARRILEQGRKLLDGHDAYTNETEKLLAEYRKCVELSADMGLPEAQRISGEKYFKDRKYDLAAYRFRQAAISGDVLCMNKLGRMLQLSQIEPFDYVDKRSGLARLIGGADQNKDQERCDQIFYFHLMAAERGNADSQMEISYYYENGVGLHKKKQDKAASEYWLEKSAYGGNNKARCSFALGLLRHAEEKSKKEAFVLLDLAARDVHNFEPEYAIDELARCYANGVGVAKNIEMAYMWLSYLVMRYSRKPIIEPYGYSTGKWRAHTDCTKLEAAIPASRCALIRKLAEKSYNRGLHMEDLPKTLDENPASDGD